MSACAKEPNRQTEVFHIQASEDRLREGTEPQTELLQIQASESRLREGAEPGK
jgi:cellobiose-specific phosphotransferase system component IIA